MRFAFFARLRSPVLARPRWRAFRKSAAGLLHARRFTDADRVLARGLVAYPDHPELMLDHALSAHNSGRYRLAVTRWEAAMRVAPSQPMCHAGLAANLREIGDIERARGVIDDALRRFPRHVAMITEAARIAAAQGRFAEALPYWRRAAARRRPHVDWLQGHAQCLVILGRFDAAQAVLAAARKKFPDHRGLDGVAGLLATAREDWPKAVAHWRAYRRRFPDDPTGWEQLGLALQGAALARTSDAEGSWSAAPEPAVPAKMEVDVVEDEPLRRLMLRFESLGDNCELGLVQRRYGAEPLGLLRWNNVGYDRLLAALAQRFEGMGEAPNTELALAANGEYFVRDRRWHLGMHTFLHAGQVEPDALLQKMCRRVVFLREKLLADLAAAEKIFVYRSHGLDEDRLAALLYAVRRIGPATLLVVQPADAAAFRGNPGDVVEVADGCFVGYLTRLGVTDIGTWNIAFDEWVSVCSKVAVATAEGRQFEDAVA